MSGSIFSHLPNRLIMDIVKLRTDADRAEVRERGMEVMAELGSIWKACDYEEIDQGVETRDGTNCDMDFWESLEFWNWSVHLRQ